MSIMWMPPVKLAALTICEYLKWFPISTFLSKIINTCSGERETDPGILGWSAWLQEVREAPRSQGREAFVGEQEDFMSKMKLHQRWVEVDEDEGWPLEVCVGENWSLQGFARNTGQDYVET